MLKYLYQYLYCFLSLKELVMITMASQDTRKAQQVGAHGSLNITIPKCWAEFHGIKKHTRLKLLWDGILVVFPEERKDLELKAKKILLE